LSLWKIRKTQSLGDFVHKNEDSNPKSKVTMEQVSHSFSPSRTINSLVTPEPRKTLILCTPTTNTLQWAQVKTTHFTLIKTSRTDSQVQAKHLPTNNFQLRINFRSRISKSGPSGRTKIVRD